MKTDVKTLMTDRMPQLVGSEVWHDEKGHHVPTKYLSKSDKLKEKQTAKILKEALGMHEKLSNFKKVVADISIAVYNAVAKEDRTPLYGEPAKDGKVKKGNFTYFNFERTIKVEVNIQDHIEFDDLHIGSAKTKFDEFLAAEVTTKNDYTKALITGAFESKKGKLDVKKVFDLLAKRVVIKDSLFQEACDLIEKSIRRPDSTTYFRVSVKNENGKFETVNLNFSSI